MGVLTDLNDRITDVQARDHVREVTRRSGSSFFWAMRRLDYERRNAMYAVYAFCREVDDIADDVTPPALKIEQLKDARVEIGRIFDDGATTKTGRALQHIIDVYDLDKRDLDSVIDGMMTDAAATVRFENMKELRLYMDRVACSVGRMSNQIFGIAEPTSSELATSLGEAFQLTNILRDLDEDAKRGRLYLPISLLRTNGIELDDPMAVIAHAGMNDVCHELADKAMEQFATARNLLADVDPKQAKPIVMMMEAYWIILTKLRKRGWQTPRASVSPSILERLRVILRYGI